MPLATSSFRTDRRAFSTIIAWAMNAMRIRVIADRPAYSTERRVRMWLKRIRIARPYRPGATGSLTARASVAVGAIETAICISLPFTRA